VTTGNWTFLTNFTGMVSTGSPAFLALGITAFQPRFKSVMVWNITLDPTVASSAEEVQRFSVFEETVKIGIEPDNMATTAKELLGRK
jgi:hypothetical protein